MSLRTRCPSCDCLIDLSGNKEEEDAERRGIHSAIRKKNEFVKSKIDTGKKMKTPVLFQWETNDDWLAIEQLTETMRHHFYVHTAKHIKEPIQVSKWNYLHINVLNGKYTLCVSSGGPAYYAVDGPADIGDLMHLYNRMKAVRDEFLSDGDITVSIVD